MHLDEFGVNTIGNQSKPVCPKYPGLSWKSFNVLFLQPFSVQGAVIVSNNKKCGYPGCGIKQLASSRVCDLETSITTSGSIRPESLQIA